MTVREQRVAIVTGGSRGIGRAISERLARDGMAVGVGYLRDKVAADLTTTAIRAAGGRSIAVQVDVAEQVSVELLFDAVVSEFGGVDVVVHSAGSQHLGTVADLDLDGMDRMHRTNIRGTFVVDQQAARRVRPGGAIINLSSSVRKLALPGYAGYAAAKGAVDAISPILAKELRGRDVTVNAVAPGPTATEFFFEGKDQATVERLAKLNPMERLGTPEDIAEVVSFLAGPGRWINGQTVYANGGAI